MLLHKIITSHRFTDLDLLQSHPRWNLDHLKAHWCLSWLELTSRGFTWSGAWRACSGVGRLAMVGLRAGHRVGEEVRQRTQPRHNRVGLRRPKLSGASLLSSTTSNVSSSTPSKIQPSDHMSRKGSGGEGGLEVGVERVGGGGGATDETLPREAGAAAGGCKLPLLLKAPSLLLRVRKPPENSTQAGTTPKGRPG